MKSFAVTLTVCALASAALSDAHAWCGVPGTSFTSDYFDAPIAQDPLLTKGRFWSLGRFDPATLAGDDNGPMPSSSWVRYTPSGGFYLAGDWAADFYDGCIQDPPNPQPARMAAAWSTSDGHDTYFAAMCAVEDAGGTFNTFVAIPGHTMHRVPKPVIRASSRIGNGETSLRIGHEPLVNGGVDLQGGCPLAITGFKIYLKSVPRNTQPPNGPGSREPDSGWILLGEGPLGGETTGVVSCPTDNTDYLMLTLVLDGNVELEQGSRNSTAIQCSPAFVTPGDDSDGFRLIRRPKSSKGR